MWAIGFIFKNLSSVNVKINYLNFRRWYFPLTHIIIVDEFDAFIRGNEKEGVTVRYLFEYEPLNTAGGLFHYRDQITRGLKENDSFLLLNCDVCSLYPLKGKWFKICS